MRFDSWIISVLLGSPSKRHPVLAQALARLLGSFEHLLSSLRRHRKDIIKSTLERFPPSPPRGQNQWQRTLVMSEVFMYGSAQWVMPFCNTFSTRATRKISAWGLVTEKIPCKREGEMKQSRHVVGIWFGSFRGSFLRTLFREIWLQTWPKFQMIRQPIRLLNTFSLPKFVHGSVWSQWKQISLTCSCQEHSCGHRSLNGCWLPVWKGHPIKWCVWER